MQENKRDELTIVCQRAFGKRRRKSRSLNSTENRDGGSKTGVLQSSNGDPLQPVAAANNWIKNDFGVDLNERTKVCNIVGKVEEDKDLFDSLNNSDLYLAQIDIEELQQPKEKSSNSCQQNSSKLSVSVSDELNKPQNEDPVVSNLNASSECDLFEDEDDEFSSIFFPNYSTSQSQKDQANVSHKLKMNKKSIDEGKVVIDNLTDNKPHVIDYYSNVHVDENEIFYGSEEKLDFPIFEGQESPSRIPLDSLIKDGNKASIQDSSVRTGGSISLKEKLKQRLLMNGSMTSANRSDEDKRRQAALAAARIEASQIRKEGTSVDIGPFYGLPSKVQELFKSLRGIGSLYDWQDECLKLSAVREHQNLIYTLPTSGGKTLVAEILILRELLCHQKDALLVLPFVSIVQEKVRTITEFASELGFLVEEYAGSKGRFPPIKRRDKHSLYIATIEKGHSLVNSLVENGRLDNLGLVVVDELHMLGEGGSRGANLESLLMKILHSKAAIQIIGMSATLNNLKDLQKFLQAEVYANDFRPVSLQEYVKVEENLYQVKPLALDPSDMLQHSRVVLFPYTPECQKRDPDQLLGLVTEIIPDNSCLVFCSTKRNCENVAQMLSELICKYYRNLSIVKKDKRKRLLRELQLDGNGKICPVLKYTVHFGIAYHHSGLTADERRLIEDAYLEGTLCVLTCTSTLAAGVNLPARRVILRSPYVGMNFIRLSQYKQMTGRAGRAGIDSQGESILITKRQDRLMVKELLAGPKDVCHSSLAYGEGKGVQSLLLSAIGLKLVTSVHVAFDFFERSLLHIQSEKLGVDVSTLTKEALRILVDKQLLAQVPDTAEEDENKLLIKVTDLGRATFKGSVDHAYSCQLYEDLKVSEQSLVLSNHFHLLYLVTPYDTAAAISPAWDVYYHQFSNLSEAEVHVAKLVGISESYLNRRALGLSSRQKIDVMATNRFFLTLMLWKLWNQVSVWDVAVQFSQPRGFVQNLLTQSASFASCVYHFCLELEEFWAFQDLLANFVKRLSFCVTAELVPLMEITGVKHARAKQLLSIGFTTLASLAVAEPDELVSKIEHMSKRQAQQIVSAAKNLVEEKTAALLEEVETLVSVPMATS